VHHLKAVLDALKFEEPPHQAEPEKVQVCQDHLGVSWASYGQ